MIAGAQGRQRLGQPCQVLGDVDESDGQIPRRMQDGQAKGTYQDDIAGRGGADDA